MASNGAGILSSMEIDAIGEILNISMGSSATSVSQLLGQQVNITTPRVEVIKTSEFDIKTYEPAIGVEIKYVAGLEGNNILILKTPDVKEIVGLLLQTDFSDHEFVMDEMNIGAICEVMNQMMGASATALSQFLNRTINISPPSSFTIESSEQFKEKYLGSEEDVVAIYFDLMIGDKVNSTFINVMRIDLAKDLVSNFGLTPEEEPEPPAAPPQADRQPVPAPQQTAPPQATAPPAPTQAVFPEARVPRQAAQPQVPVSSAPAAPLPPAAASGTVQPSVAQAVYAYPPQTPPPVPYPQQAYMQPPYYPPQTEPGKSYSVSGAIYPSFDSEDIKLNQSESANLGLIMSVPLQITVEIGRTTKKIKEILDFSAGTIVELNRQAGSQVDVYVNGKAIAKGNVVVVDDNYGVRITEVINSSEIMKIL